MRAKRTAPARRAAGDGARVPASVIRRLARFFERNGYARWQASRRVEEEGWQRYKKGDEVRLVANSAAELKVIRALLRAAGFRPGRPFAKGRQYRQPLYGRQVVVAFLALVERARKAARRASKTALRRRGSRVTSLARRQR